MFFDIEINEKDPDKFIQIVKGIAPTFGGINLEDIKAPEAFYIEQKLKEELDIPLMHDDQHGTAIISAAALINSLQIANKNIGESENGGKWCRSGGHCLYQFIYFSRS
jgi:malate dehydrogenase (oxaloacetate-decarboxylating)(NADP+)